MNEKLRNELRARVEKLESAGFAFPSPEERRRAITSIRLSMADYIKDDQIRRKALGWLFVGETCSISTTALHDAQLFVLKRWLNILPAPDGGWTISEAASGELRQLANYLGGAPAEPGPLVRAAIGMGGEVEGVERGTKKKLYFQFDE